VEEFTVNRREANDSCVQQEFLYVREFFCRYKEDGVPCTRPCRSLRPAIGGCVMELLAAPALRDLFELYGLYVLFCFIMLESMGIPMPGETILIIAGIYAGSTRRIEIIPLIATATLAAIVGDNLGYLVGRLVGQASLRKYGGYLRLDERRLKVGRYLFLKQGGKIVFFGRFVAFLRAFAAVLAGANQMSWPRFLAMNALGGLCWASLVGGGAYVFGERIERVTATLGALLLFGGIVLIAGAALYFRRYEAALEQLAEQSCSDS
jgi:membrane protein DedA with SNARE-associated domain